MPGLDVFRDELGNKYRINKLVQVDQSCLYAYTPHKICGAVSSFIVLKMGELVAAYCHRLKELPR